MSSFSLPWCSPNPANTLRRASKEQTVTNDIAKLDMCSPTETSSYARTSEARRLVHPGVGWKPKWGELCLFSSANSHTSGMAKAGLMIHPIIPGGWGQRELLRQEDS